MPARRNFTASDPIEDDFQVYYARKDLHGDCSNPACPSDQDYILGITVGEDKVNLCPKLEGILLEKLLASYISGRKSRAGQIAGFRGFLRKMVEGPTDLRNAPDDNGQEEGESE